MKTHTYHFTIRALPLELGGSSDAWHVQRPDCTCGPMVVAHPGAGIYEIIHNDRIGTRTGCYPLPVVWSEEAWG